jgi:hypothetical protein
MDAIRANRRSEILTLPCRVVGDYAKMLIAAIDTAFPADFDASGMGISCFLYLQP